MMKKKHDNNLIENDMVNEEVSDNTSGVNEDTGLIFTDLIDTELINQAAREYEEKELAKDSKKARKDKSSNDDRTSRAKERYNEKKAKEKEDKRSAFGKFMLIYVAILIIAMIVICSLLWNKLSAYQDNIDAEKSAKEYATEVKHAPQIFFQDYLANLSTDDWINLWKQSYPGTLNSDDDIRTYIEDNLVNVDYSPYKMPGFDIASPEYLIQDADGQVLASFTLSGNELDWYMNNVNVNLVPDITASISVPEICQVTCNGTLLDDGYITESVSGNSLKNYKDELINPVYYNTYEVCNLINEPEFIISSSSDEYTIATDQQGNYNIVLNDGSNYTSRAQAFIQALLAYYSNGKESVSANMATALGHVASNSEASNVIRQSLDGLKWSTYTGAVYDITVSDAYKLADNCVCVDVKYVNTNVTSDQGTSEGEVYRVYFIDMGNGYQIYDFSLL